MFGPKIKLGKDLYDRVAAAAEQAGYASVDEFVTHILEKEVAGEGGGATDDEVQKQLRGLGYIE